jgi:predicted nucleic acid-binding protein
MRIVLDTNVFVSAILKVNSLPFLVVGWIDRHGGLLKSAVTEQEILHVLARPHIAAVTIPSFRDDLAKLLAGPSWSPSPSGSRPAVIRTTTNSSSWLSTAMLNSSSPATAICWRSIRSAKSRS